MYLKRQGVPHKSVPSLDPPVLSGSVKFEHVEMYSNCLLHFFLLLFIFLHFPVVVEKL